MDDPIEAGFALLGIGSLFGLAVAALMALIAITIFVSRLISAWRHRR